MSTIKKFNERIDWRGQWIPEKDEHALDKVREYSMRRQLTKELLEITEKYQGQIKDKTITEAIIDVIKKYDKGIEIKRNI